MSKEVQSSKSIIGILLILLVLIWGSSFTLIKKSLLTFSVGEVGTLRMFIVALALLPFAIRA